MKKLLILFIGCLMSIQLFAFCGFYVAKADATLFNKKSQVILVRDGNRTVVTMSNDFRGDVRDFAMVVPVPEILKEKNIRVVNRDLFDKIDAYSAPRMAEYYDTDPCMIEYNYKKEWLFSHDLGSIAMLDMVNEEREEDEYQVTIEAEYSIEEYDVIILSAKESNGLQRWLMDNDYRIPQKAEEVLEPYIKNDMKFFVVKVNLDRLPTTNQGYLRPLQIEYSSEKFMLPIRLGMANANGEQDMVVYAFTKQGRIECANYRTVKLPTDRNIPKFIKDKNDFGEFYVDLFEKAYEREGKNAIFLEYAWNVSPSAGVKCDPCVSPPPVFQEFANAGVDWVTDMSWNSSVFFTRLHVRYSREKFPQDLQFQVTPNMENYQCRYVITNPPQSAFECDNGQQYLRDLEMNRKKEVDELAALTGWENPRYAKYIYEYSDLIKDEDRSEVVPILFKGDGSSGKGILLILIGILIMTIVGWRAMAIKKRMEYI